MDILSLFTSNSQPVKYQPQTEAEAFVTLLYMLKQADNISTSSETNTIVNAVLGKKMFSYYDTEQLFEVAALNYEQYGASLLEPIIDKISTENRKMVFVYCVDVVLSDGEMHSNEAAALNKLAAYFSIEADFAKSCLEVIQAKNFGNKQN